MATMATSATPLRQIEPWLFRPLRRAAGSCRLLCLPHAGGSPSMFREWATKLPEAMELVGVRLPGRDGRIAEPACPRWPELLDRLDAALEPVLDLPFVLFGYSMGGM